MGDVVSLKSRDRLEELADEITRTTEDLGAKFREARDLCAERGESFSAWCRQFGGYSRPHIYRLMDRETNGHTEKTAENVVSPGDSSPYDAEEEIEEEIEEGVACEPLNFPRYEVPEHLAPFFEMLSQVKTKADRKLIRKYIAVEWLM